MLAPAVAYADPPLRDVHMGLNMRTDLGTHAYRLEFGARWEKLETFLVLDPSSSEDGQTDLDIVFAWWVRPAQWALFTGWRNSAFNILGENRWHENLLVGVSSRLPQFGPRWVRFDVGLEMLIDVVRHGSNVPAEWISFASPRHFDDLINFGLFMRAEFTAPF